MVFYVLTATSLRYKVIRHKAILYNDGHQDLVLHHNESGVHLEPLASFMEGGRSILKKEKHVCRDILQITDYYVKHENDEFNILFNNCEQFVNSFLNEIGENVYIKSPQRDAIILTVLAVTGGLVFFLKKKFGWKLTNLIRTKK